MTKWLGDGYPVWELEDDLDNVDEDTEAVKERWRAWIIDNGGNSLVLDRYDQYLLVGKHPEVAAKDAMSDYKIDYYCDEFLQAETQNGRG